jgi:hypothetical protein
VVLYVIKKSCHSALIFSGWTIFSFEVTSPMNLSDHQMGRFLSHLKHISDKALGLLAARVLNSTYFKTDIKS